MLKAWTAALFVTLGVLVAACDDSGGGDASPTGTTAPATTPQPSTASVPAKPAALADYAAAIAGYASASPAAVDTCLADLLATWAMPGISPADTCQRANTDADPNDELVVVASAPVDDVVSYVVFVLDGENGVFEVAYESPQYPAVASGIGPVLGAGDLNGDGIGEVAYTSQLCSEGRCFNIAYIFQGPADGHTAITPEGGVGVVDGSFELRDTDGNGTQELLASGTRTATADAGPQRHVVETWAWDGSAYVLTGTAPGSSDYLYHRVSDADELLAAGDYAGAEQAYLAANGDAGLLLWKADDNERNELDAYALFRAAVAHLLGGGDVQTANGYLDTAKALPNTLHAQLAASFQAGYAAKGEIGVGCTAINEDVRFNEAEYAAFWDYGTDNPPFDPTTFCPY